LGKVFCKTLLEQTMNAHDQDNGPRRFIRNWLSFNEQRPIRTSLLRKLLVAILTMLAACFLLVAVSEMR
jgi:hypothetical protein